MMNPKNNRYRSTRRIRCITLRLALGAALSVGAAGLGSAGIWNKADNANNLGAADSWVENSGWPQVGTDVARWNNASGAAASAALGADLTWGALNFTAWGADFTINAGNTLSLTNGGITMAAANDLTLSCPVTLLANQAWSVNTGRTLAAGGTVSGAFTLTKVGAGTLTLNSANTFTNLVVAGGAAVGTTDAGALGAGTLILGGGVLQLANAPGSPLSFNRNTTVSTYSAIDSDVTAAGAGNTYTLGTLAIGAQQLTINKGANVTSGTAGVTFGATTLSVSGTTFDVGAGANLTLNTLTGATLNFWKQGSGTLTFASAASTARTTGATYLNAGTVVLGGTVGTSDALGTAGATLLLSGGTLDLASDTSVLAHGTTLLGSASILSDKATAASAGITHTLGALTILGANTLTIDQGANVSGGTPVVAFGAATMNANTTFLINSGAQLTLSTLVNSGFTPTFSGAGNATVTGAISGGGGLVMSGAGTLTLAANSYTGANRIESGTVTLGAATGLGPAATAVLTMTGGTLNVGSVGSTLLALTGNPGSAITSASGTPTLTVNPVANSTSSFAGNIGGGGGTLAVTVNGATGGALTLSGTNTYTGLTTLTAGRLNINNNNALGTNALVLTAGIIDNTSGGDVTLANNNALTLNGNFTFGGSGNLSFGTGKLTSAATPKTLSLMGTGNKTLTFDTWSNNVASAVTTVLAMPDSTSTLNIGKFVASSATAATFQGNANVTITGGIQPNTAATPFTYSSVGTLTLSGASTYTGATVLNAGTLILDATGGAATLQTTAPAFRGGTFVFKGDASGTGQTLGNVTMDTVLGASSIQVVGGALGTTLTLGTMTPTTVGTMMNINLSGTSPAVTTTTANNNDNLFGARGAVTVTTGGTTEFATRNASSNLVQYTGQTAFLGAGSISTINYKLSGNGQLTLDESMNSLRLTTTGAGQSLDLNGKVLTLTSGGLLFVGADAYEIKDVLGGGSLKSGTDLIFHNFGDGILTISAVCTNTSGVSLDGPGTTVLSGVNTYTGPTLAGGGAVLSINANSGLGAVATGAGLTLNNATLQATSSFGLDNAGANIRAITLGAGGGTFDVTGANTLTNRGVISGTGSLTKKGTGALVTTNVNTYTGGFTYVQNGVLQFGGPAANSIPVASFVVLGSTNGNTSGVLVLGDADNTKSQTVAGLFTSGAGAGNAIVGGNAANSTLTFTGSLLTPSTFSGTIGGAGANQNNLALTITAGSLTLSGTNTYTGGTTLSGGVLNLNSTNAIGTNTLAITAAAAVIDNTSGSAKTNNNNVTTTTGFVFGGANDLSFGSGTLSSTAATPISTYGNSTLTFGGGLVNNIAAGTALTLTVNGSTGALNLGGYNMQNNSGGIITDIINGSGNVNITGPITPGSFNDGNALTYNGTGILTLSGANTYTGLTTLANAGGTLKFAPGASLNGGAGDLTLTTGTVDLGGQSISVGAFTPAAGRVTSSSPGGSLTTANLVGGAANFGGALALNLSLASGAAAVLLDGSFYNTGDITLNNASANAITARGANVVNGGNITLNANSTGGFLISAANINPTGTIVNSGSGTGTTTLSGVIGTNVTAIANTGTSPLTVSGALYVNPAGVVVTQSGTGLLTLGTATINGIGSLTVVNSSTTGGNITFSAIPSFAGDLTFQANASSGTPGIITASGTQINNAGRVINSGSGVTTNTISGIIGPSVTEVIQNGASPLKLSGVNTYAGDTTISSGTLIYGGVTAIPSGAGKGNVTVNGTLDLAGVSPTINGLFGAGVIDNRTGTLTYTLTVGANDRDGVFSGTIQDTSGLVALTKTGGGTLTLSGENIYAGVTTISAGVLQIGAGGAAGTLGTNNVVNNAALIFNRSDAITVSNLISGAGSLTQAGSGTTTLIGAKTYTGPTTVSNGTLLVHGALGGGGQVSVTNTGTLGGTGTVAGAVSIYSGSTLAPGTNSIGILTATNGLAFNGGTFVVKVSATNSGAYGQAKVTGGSVTIDAGSKLDVSGIFGYAPATGDGLWIVNNTGAGTTAGSFAGLAEGAQTNIAGSDFTIHYNADFGTRAITGGNDILLANSANQVITGFTPANGSVFVVSQSAGLFAQASSGLAVSFTNLPGDPVSWSNATSITFTATGTVSIVASQAGDADWNAAPSVTNTYIVKTGVTIGGTFSVSNKVYDAGTTAAISVNNLTLAGTNGSDDVTLNAVAAFGDKTVGTGKTVTLTNSTLAGLDAGKYALLFTDAPTTNADITVKEVTVSAAANNKPYDGTTDATITVSGTNGVIAPDDVAVTNLVGTFAQADVATGIAVTPALTLTGGDAPNYNLTQPAGLTANITIIDQTIAFPALPAQAKTNIVTLSATASSGLAVTNFTVLSGPGSIEAGTVTLTFTNVGEVSIQADQSGNINYNAAPPVTITFPVYDSTQAGTTNTIPWSDNFDDHFSYFNLHPLINGTNGWYGDSADIIVQTNVFAPGGGIKAAMIPIDCTLSNRFAPNSSTSVWIQMDLRPSLYDATNSPEVDTNVAAMFHINTGGYFVVHDGPATPTNWVTLTNVQIPTNGTNWIAIKIYEDFANTNWDLYAKTNVGLPADWVLVTNQIGFINTNLANFAGFGVYNGATTSYLDNVSVTSAYSAPIAVKVNVETAPDGTGIIVPATNIVSGSNLMVYAVTRDASDNFVTNIAADTWSLIARTGGVVDGNLVAAGDMKSATFTGVLAGTANIQATSGSLTTNASGTITVVAGAADKLAFTTQPSESTAAGVPFARQPAVTIQDAAGNTVTTATNDVALARTAGSGVLGGTTNKAAVNGVADFAGLGLSIDLVGADKALTATSAGLTPAITAPAFAITAGAADKIAFTTQPPTATPAGTVFATNPVVKIQDAFGNTVTTGADSTTNVALALTAGQGVLSGTTNVDAIAGVAEFPGLSIDLAGDDKVLTATATLTAGVRTTNTSPAFAITVPAPTALAATLVTSSNFVANWTAVAIATNYLVDVGTTNDFSAYLGGFSNFAAGDVLTCTVTGVVQNSTYYYRVRAQSAGMTSTNSGTIDVTIYGAPSLGAATVSNVMATTADLGGSVTATNGYPVTERGIYWGTNSGTVWADGIKYADNGVFDVGAFSFFVTNLPAGRTNYFLAYAANDQGTNVTAESSFLTRPGAP
ncbi:MAG: autotransporter-associated beta strand repeat-containing protein, partial [Kiritimatiellia bacterium]